MSLFNRSHSNAPSRFTSFPATQPLRAGVCGKNLDGLWSSGVLTERMRRTAILFFVLLCLWTAAPARERYCVERTYGAGIGSGGGGRRSEGLQAYRAKEVDRRAVITEKPQPAYTDEARENGTRGRCASEPCCVRRGRS